MTIHSWGFSYVFFRQAFSFPFEFLFLPEILEKNGYELLGNRSFLRA
jgi:hypothetical protein